MRLLTFSGEFLVTNDQLFHIHIGFPPIAEGSVVTAAAVAAVAAAMTRLEGP